MASRNDIGSILEQAFKDQPRDQLVAMAGLPALVALGEASNCFGRRYAYLLENAGDPIDVLAAVLDLRNTLHRIVTGRSDHKGLDADSVHRLLRGEERDMLFAALAGICDMNVVENRLFDSGNWPLSGGRMKEFVALLEDRLEALDANIEAEQTSAPAP